MALRHHRPWAPPPADRALAAELGPHAAWLPLADRVLFVRHPPDLVATPLVSLIQGAWERLPGGAHAALRQRIRTTASPCPLDRATLQLAAKRATWEIPADPGPVELAVEDLTPAVLAARARSQASVFDPGVPTLHDPGELDRWLPAPADTRPLAERDRPLLAALVDPSGRLLLAARNTAGANRTLHAELNLVHAWWMATGRPLPAGSRLVATLRPCRMCAALIARAAAGPLQVLYLHDDPGPLARDTELDKLGWVARTAG